MGTTGSPILGIGLYSLSEAARLVGVRPRTISRWMRGYTYTRAKERRSSPPLWKADVLDVGTDIQLSFRDLIELKLVSQFVEKGIPLNVVRSAYDFAKSSLNLERPFLTGKFQTNGKTIYLEGVERSGEKSLLDLRSKQYVFRQVVERQFKELDFDQGTAVRWRPFHGKTSIVIDPKRSFGVPIAEESGVPVSALVAAVEAEGSVQKAAAVFEVRPQVVRDAIKYVEELKAA